jgi:hypothetical protein
MSPNNSNRPMTLKVGLHENPTLRAALAAHKVRQILAKDKAR